jgi:hypothetical protein
VDGLRAPWARIALLLIAAQLAAITAPCPDSPAWKRLDAARELSTPPPCPGHAADGHDGARHAQTFLVFRCPCGCGDALPPATGPHHSRAGILPAPFQYRVAPQSPTPAPEPARRIAQVESSGVKHVPRAA